MMLINAVILSIRWLKENVRLNKVESRVDCHNLDGRQFIRDRLPAVLKGEKSSGNVLVLMNLPALAVEFLDAFRGVLDDCDDDDVFRGSRLPATAAVASSTATAAAG